MKKIYSFLLNAVLFLIFWAFWTGAYIIVGGFTEIIFKWNFMINYRIGAAIIIFLSFVTAMALYFYLPLKRYNATAGRIITDRQTGLKPIALYGKILGVMILAYLLTWGISGMIFGSIVKKQEKALESMGMSFDWKSYYPEWDEKDNAATYLKQAGDSMEASSHEEIKKLWELLRKEDYDMKAISKDIDKLMQNSQKSVASLDEALKFHKLIWYDYSAFQDKDIFMIPIPAYSPIRNLVQLCMMDAINSAYRNDWNAPERALSRAVGI